MGGRGVRGWRRPGFDLSGVLGLAPADATVVPAVLACVCTAGPLVVLLAAGRLDIAAYAAFGSFTGLYGRNEPYRRRATTLAIAAATLVASVGAGAVVGVLSGSGVIHVLLVAVAAGLTRFFLDAFRAGSPGALMPTFAAAVTVTTVTDVGRIPVAVGVCAAAAVWSWLVCMSPWLIARDGPRRIATARALAAVAHRVETATAPSHDRTRHAAALAVEHAWHALGGPARDHAVRQFERYLVHAESVMRRTRLAVAAGSPPPAGDADECARLATLVRRGSLPPIAVTCDEQAELAGVDVEAELARTSLLMRTPRPSRRVDRAVLRPASPAAALAVRTASAAAVAGLAAAAVGLGYSYWASVSAVAVLAAMNLSGTTQRAIQRGAGTAVGVLIGVAVLALHPAAEVAVVLVILCTGLAELTVTRNYALAVLFATPLALLLATLANPLPPLDLARDRLLDTVVGAAVAVAVAVLLPNRGLAQALHAALDDAQSALDVASTTRPEERLTAARTLAARLSALRTSYDAAAGEPWFQDIPVEKVLMIERDCHTTLARLTA